MIEPRNHTTVTLFCSGENSYSEDHITWYSDCEVITEDSEDYKNGLYKIGDVPGLPSAADCEEVREEVRAWWRWKKENEGNLGISVASNECAHELVSRGVCLVCNKEGVE